MKTMPRIFTVTLALAGGLLVSGCGMQQSAPVSVQGSALQGRVYGGRQPITGATIQLYAAGETGYGSAYSYSTGTSLLGTNSVTTNGSGGFTISHDYTCPTLSTQVYIVASGGNPGLAGTETNPVETNPQSVIMAALGPCGSLSTSTFIDIDELTTVASVWALSPFMTGVANVGTSPTNVTGLVNAFASVNKLANTANGTVPGLALPSGATAPLTKMNTLANILAACINSAGGSASDGGSSICGELFIDTTVNGTAPTDTLQAALNLAQHPNLATADLTGISTATGPYQPSLSLPPNDYSLVITYSGNGISAPKGIATDSSGNVWIANSGSDSITEMANSGMVLSGSSGYTVGSLNAPSAIAVDASGYTWIANTGNNTVTQMNSAGTSASIYSNAAFDSPVGVAIDMNGNAWIANSANSTVSQINTVTGVVSYVGTNASSANGIAVDPN